MVFLCELVMYIHLYVGITEMYSQYILTLIL
jgi:hypothetical protein